MISTEKGGIMNLRRYKNREKRKKKLTVKEKNIMATMIDRPVYEIKIKNNELKKEPVADKNKIDKLIESLSQYLSNK